MKYACTIERFLQDTNGHQFKTILDQGTHRHLRFRKPDSLVGWFDIVTWPGYLCISGDMGNYAFTRTEDMFSFFRPGGQQDKLGINPQYWSEKLCAADSHGAHAGDSVKKFSPEIFDQKIKQWLDEYISNAVLDEGEAQALREEIASSMDGHSFDHERDAISAALNFKHNDDYVFQDFWEVETKDYTFRFIWCLYAIVWAISLYDTAKAVGGQAHA